MSGSSVNSKNLSFTLLWPGVNQHWCYPFCLSPPACPLLCAPFPRASIRVHAAMRWTESGNWSSWKRTDPPTNGLAYSQTGSRSQSTIWLHESQCQDLSSWSRMEQSLLQQNKAVPDWTDHETMAVSFSAASCSVLDPLNLLETACRISHTEACLFPVPSQILVLLLRFEMIASLGSSSSRMLELWLNFK